jgi:hypothetical protein
MRCVYLPLEHYMPRPVAPNIGEPEPGHYVIRLVRKGPEVAACITFNDGLWAVIINGTPSVPDTDPWQVKGMDRVWPYGRPIDEARYRYLMALKDWAEANDPEHPAANPRTPVDLTAIKPIF